MSTSSRATSHVAYLPHHCFVSPSIRGRQLPCHLPSRVRLGTDPRCQSTRFAHPRATWSFGCSQCDRVGTTICRSWSARSEQRYGLFRCRRRASTCLRSCFHNPSYGFSAGRRSRNGHAPSPAPGSIGYSHSSSSFGGTASPAQQPVWQAASALEQKSRSLPTQRRIRNGQQCFVAPRRRRWTATRCGRIQWWWRWRWIQLEQERSTGMERVYCRQ